MPEGFSYNHPTFPYQLVSSQSIAFIAPELSENSLNINREAIHLMCQYISVVPATCQQANDFRFPSL